jgi:hypothetical protein
MAGSSPIKQLNMSLDPEADWKKPRSYWTLGFLDPDMPKLPRWSSDDVDRFAQEFPSEGQQLKALRFRFKLRVRKIL